MKLLSCPYLWQQKSGQEQFHKELPYFFDQTTRLLGARFCEATIQGRRYFIGKPADINDGWIRYIRAIQRQLLHAEISTRNLSILLSAMEKSCTTRTAPVLARWPSSELFAYVCVAAAAIWGRGLVKEIRYHHHRGVAAAATVYQKPHFKRGEGQELFAFLLDLHVWIYCSAWSNLMQEI